VPSGITPKRPVNGIALETENSQARILEAAGIRPIRLYDLRHTAATLAVAAGVSVKVISDQLGHASISFTLERYSHVLPSIQDEAAARVERMLMGPPACVTSRGTAPRSADPST
jgi:integrase